MELITAWLLIYLVFYTLIPVCLSSVYLSLTNLRLPSLTNPLWMYPFASGFHQFFLKKPLPAFWLPLVWPGHPGPAARPPPWSPFTRRWVWSPLPSHLGPPLSWYTPFLWWSTFLSFLRVCGRCMPRWKDLYFILKLNSLVKLLRLTWISFFSPEF